MRVSHGLYLATITSLVCIPLYKLLPLVNFICNRRGFASPDAQYNPPQICQTPLPVHHSRTKLTPRNCKVGGEFI